MAVTVGSKYLDQNICALHAPDMHSNELRRFLSNFRGKAFASYADENEFHLCIMYQPTRHRFDPAYSGPTHVKLLYFEFQKPMVTSGADDGASDMYSD
jgi:hypothetical protein